jgi:hypothetical protein
MWLSKLHQVLNMLELPLFAFKLKTTNFSESTYTTFQVPPLSPGRRFKYSKLKMGKCPPWH